MVLLLLLLVALLSPTGEAGEWRSHPQRPSPTPHEQTCPDATLMHSLGLVHLREFLNSGKPWSHLPCSNFGSMSTAGRLESFFQGKSSGATRPSHTPVPTWRFFRSRFQGNLKNVGVSSCVRTSCWQRLTAWEGEEQCGPAPLWSPPGEPS